MVDNNTPSKIPSSPFWLRGYKVAKRVLYFFVSGQFEKLIRYAQFKISPQKSMELAEVAMEKEDWSEAVKRWQIVLSGLDDRATAGMWINLSRGNRNQARFVEAERAIMEGTVKHPEHPGLKSELAEIAMDKEDWSEAVRRWQAVIDTLGDSVPASVRIKQSHARKKYALSIKYENEKIIKVTDINLKELGYSTLVKELSRVNKSRINWSKLEKMHYASTKDFVSIIVLVLNNLDLTIRCIESVLQAKANVNFELIIFNNGSNLDTIMELRNLYGKYPSLKVVHSEQNLNFALGNNLGFSEAIGNISVFLNNDTYVTDFWLDSLVSALKTKGIKAAQPTLLYPDDTVQCAGVVFSKKSALGYPLYANLNKDDENVVKNRILQAITGACMAVYSVDFAYIKGFDTSFVNGQEDVDFCLRLNEKRSSSAFCTKNSVVYHDEGKTPGRGKYVIENRSKFVERWRSKVKPDDENYYKKDGYYVDSWVLDSDKYRDHNVEIYRPILKKRDS